MPKIPEIKTDGNPRPEPQCLCKILRTTFWCSRIFGLTPLTWREHSAPDGQRMNVCEYSLSRIWIAVCVLMPVAYNTAFIATNEFQIRHTAHTLYLVSECVYYAFASSLAVLNIVQARQLASTLNDAAAILYTAPRLCTRSQNRLLRCQRLGAFLLALQLLLQYAVTVFLITSDRFFAIFELKIFLSRGVHNIPFIFYHQFCTVCVLYGCAFDCFGQSMKLALETYPSKDSDTESSVVKTVHSKVNRCRNLATGLLKNTVWKDPLYVAPVTENNLARSPNVILNVEMTEDVVKDHVKSKPKHADTITKRSFCDNPKSLSNVKEYTSRICCNDGSINVNSTDDYPNRHRNNFNDINIKSKHVVHAMDHDTNIKHKGIFVTNKYQKHVQHKHNKTHGSVDTNPNEEESTPKYASDALVGSQDFINKSIDNHQSGDKSADVHHYTPPTVKHLDSIGLLDRTNILTTSSSNIYNLTDIRGKSATDKKDYHNSPEEKKSSVNNDKPPNKSNHHNTLDVSELPRLYKSASNIPMKKDNLFCKSAPVIEDHSLSFITGDLARDLDALRRLHERICRSLRSANVAFNPQIGLVLCVELAVIVMHLYSVILYVNYDDVVTPEMMTINFFDWLFLSVHALGLLVFLMVAQNIHDSHKGPEMSLLDHMNAAMSPEELIQARFFCMKLHQLPAEFTAGRLFPIGVRLLAPITGSIVTYVLVALQFKLHKSSTMETDGLLDINGTFNVLFGDIN